jgi:type I restriction enzyme S subunit
LNTGWTTKKLEEVCQFSNGLWKGEKPPLVNVGVIRNTNFTKEGTLDYSDIAFIDVEAKKLERHRLQLGDIILEKSGGGPKQPVGRVALFDKRTGNFSFSNFTASLRVLDPSELDFRFLHRFLYWTYVSGVTEGMQSHSTGIRNLDGDAYKAIQIDYPRLSEQQRIVAVLDEAFAAIATARANTEQNLRNAHELAEEATESAFPPDIQSGAGARTLVELCDLIVDCEHKTAPTQDEGIPSIRTPNVGRGRLVIDGVRRVSEETYKEWTRRVEPKPGDLILAREAPAGNVAVIPDGLRVCLGQRTVLLRPNRSVFEPAYLAHLLLRRESQRRMLAHSRGATVQHVNVKDIRAFKVVSIPPLDAQRAIVQKVDEATESVEKLETCLRRKLTALDTLKQSLLHEAFAGAL